MSASTVGQFLSPMSFQDPPVITPSGWIEHGPFAAWLVEATSPDLLVELGTHWGYSFFAFCEAVRTLGLDTRCVAIDTWEGDEHAGFYSDEVHDYVASVAKGYGSTATMMRMRFDQAVGSFEDGSIDVLHIDGRHLYEDAVEDFDTYLPKMSDRGVVVMHDIVERGHGFGVWRHWVELKDRYPTFEFRHEHGLGVVAVGHDAPEAIGRLTSLGEDSAEADQVRRMYSQLGRAISGAEGMRRAEELQTALAAANERLQHTTDAIARQAAGRELTLLRTVRDLERDVREARHLTPNLFKGLLRERLRAEGVRLLDSQGPEQTMRDQLAALFDADYYAAQHPELAPEEVGRHERGGGHAEVDQPEAEHRPAGQARGPRGRGEGQRHQVRERRVVGDVDLGVGEREGPAEGQLQLAAGPCGGHRGVDRRQHALAQAHRVADVGGLVLLVRRVDHGEVQPEPAEQQHRAHQAAPDPGGRVGQAHGADRPDLGHGARVPRHAGRFSRNASGRLPAL